MQQAAKSGFPAGRSSGRIAHPCQTIKSNPLKRPACQSCKIKKTRCSNDTPPEEDPDASCTPCIKDGIICDYSPPLEGSPAYDVVLRRCQNRANERKHQPPKPVQAKLRKPRKRQNLAHGLHIQIKRSSKLSGDLKTSSNIKAMLMTVHRTDQEQPQHLLEGKVYAANPTDKYKEEKGPGTPEWDAKNKGVPCLMSRPDTTQDKLLHQDLLKGGDETTYLQFERIL
ncbi:hypothetical protein BKA70DRAFT_1235432 [Coprinopsis sp. MPI-PUGE-AT-0042]|nr:hypothetical protein BKA70DRAFT_1235432 [Coprinopsis sp. MPI-PUGE-AT-0042]